MLILVNPDSSSGRGGDRWPAARAELERRGLAFDAFVAPSAAAARQRLDQALADGERHFVAAGGDGTVHAVLNALMDPTTDRPRHGAVLGAIGLGSSNDFHKPLALERSLAGLPARIDLDRAEPVDVGKVVLEPPNGPPRTRYFALNASLGFVAEGNAYFNTDAKMLGWLKRRHTEAAILYTALVQLIVFRPIEAAWALDEEPESRLRFASLSVMKKVHLSGGMRYDTPVTARDGMLDVNVWLPRGRLGILRTMAGLYKGRFQGRPGTLSRRARRVRLRPVEPAHLELDGEVFLAARAEMTVVPDAVRLCG